MKTKSWQKILSIFGFAGMILSGNAQAITLGKISLDSTQLQPLRLQVELRDMEGVLPGSMTAKIAGPAQFAAAGLVYQIWFSGLEVNLVGDGADMVLQVQGIQPVLQPELDFIFEVEYLGKRLIAEYSVALPAFVAAAITQSPAAVASIAKINIAAEPVNRPSTQNKKLSKPAFVIVRPGQTLWRIAVNNGSDGVSPWQSLLALYKINPKAFKHGDIRYLMAGSRLKLPNANQLKVVSARQAKAEFDALVKSKAKSKVEYPILEEVQKQQQKVTKLALQFEEIKVQPLDLQSDSPAAVQTQNLLQQKNQSLAQGVAAQQQDSTVSQGTEAGQTAKANGSMPQAFLLIPIVLVIGLFWWIIRRGRSPSPKTNQRIEPNVVDETPISVDFLDEYESKPSSKVADPQTSAMQAQGMPERSFIEQLLQEQDQVVSKPASVNDDQAGLPSEDDTILHQQKQPKVAADEPLGYLSRAEDLNTQLDLARKFQDMGQISDAQAVLQQVLKFGNANQQAQATVLLSRLK